MPCVQVDQDREPDKEPDPDDQPDFAVRIAELVSATEAFDLDDPWGEAIAYITAVFARIEAVNLSLRVKGSHEYLRRNGRWGGGRPQYWHDAVPNPDGAGVVLVNNPESLELTLAAIDRAIKGEAVNAIVSDYNRRGIMSPQDRDRARAIANARDPEKQAARSPIRHNPWTRQAMLHILRHPGLGGYVIHEGEILLDDKGNPFMMAEPVIGDAKFEQLQLALKERSRSPERTDTPSLVPGVAHCALCGRRLYRQPNRGYDYYRCPAASKQAEFRDPCTARYIPAADLEERAKVIFLEQVGGDRYMRRIYRPGNDNADRMVKLRRSLAMARAEYDSGGYSYPGGEEEYQARIAERSALLRQAMAEGVIDPGYTLEDVGKTFVQLWAELEASGDVQGRRKLMTGAGFIGAYARGKSGPPLEIWSTGEQIRQRNQASAAGEPAAPAGYRPDAGNAQAAS